MIDSEIVHTPSATVYAGPDAVAVVRAFHLVSALKLYARSKMLMTRNATPTVLLQLATQITGKKYKRGDYTQAADDVHKWAVEMRDAIPTTIEGDRHGT